MKGLATLCAHFACICRVDLGDEVGRVGGRAARGDGDGGRGLLQPVSEGRTHHQDGRDQEVRQFQFARHFEV